MKKYARIENERVVEFFETDKDMAHLFHPSLIWVEVNSPDINYGWVYQNSSFSAPPSFSLSIEELRNEKWEEIKRERDYQEFTVFSWNSNIFDATRASQNRIILAILGAQLAISSNQEWSIDWRLADNSLITITSEQMIEVGLAMGANTQYAHEHANQLRTLIESSFTKSELDNIVW